MSTHHRCRVFWIPVIAVTLLASRPAHAGEPAVRVVSVEREPTVYDAPGRLVPPLHPARFRVTLENRTAGLCAGTLAAEVIGNVDTVYGLASQRVALGAHEKRAVTVYWQPPAAVTYDGPGGPLRVPAAEWGHEIRVAWVDRAGIGDRGRAVFAVGGSGLPARVRELAGPRPLSPLEAFQLRYRGYLANPALEPAAECRDLTLELNGLRPPGFAQGEATSGRRACLLKLRAATAGGRITVQIRNAFERLDRAWLLDAQHPAGPRAVRLYHRAAQRTFTFDMPATGPDATLVLELAKAQTIPGIPLAEMAARGEKEFGPFRDLLRDGAGRPIGSPAAWAEHRRRVRAAVCRALAVPEAPEGGPLDPVVLSEEKVAPRVQSSGDLAAGYVRRKVSIRLRAGERMTVWLLVPPGIGPFPALLALHQTVPEGKDEPVGLGGNHAQLGFGPALVDRGFVVVAPDSWGAGERLPSSGRAYDTTVPEKDAAWSLLGQRLRDHRRVIDYLETLPEVDRRRIGAVGHSLGGESTMLLTALDERVAAAAESCGFTLLRTLPNAADVYALPGNTILPLALRSRLQVPVRERRLPFDFDDCMALWAPRPVFVHGVRDDLWANATQVAHALQALGRVYRLLGADDRLAAHYSAQGHCFPHWVQADAFDWLEYWLKGQEGRGH